MTNPIQIATIGDTQIVVEEGLRKNTPEKLYILHTKNERSKEKLKTELESLQKEKNESVRESKIQQVKTQQYTDNAKKLKKELEKKWNIGVELALVDKFDTDVMIATILNIINDEIEQSRQDDEPKTSKDFVINITGGTKAMVAGAACAAYLAQSKMYYVLHPNEARGTDLVKELPVPLRAENSSRGKTDKTSGIVLQAIQRELKNKDYISRERLNKSLEKIKFPKNKVDQSGKTKTVLTPFTNQIVQYHLDKLESMGLIIRERKRVTTETTAKPFHKTSTINAISLTPNGVWFSKFPDLIGTKV